MPNLFLVMLGGAIGAGLRYHVGRIALHLTGPGFPWGTWTVNLVGGFLMGVLVGVLARVNEGGEALRLLLGVGVLGGFTTFSTFSLEVVTMIERSDWTSALAYAALSLIGAVLALFAGLSIMRGLTA